MKVALIYSADIAFQVLSVIPNCNSEKAWDIAKDSVELYEEKFVEHYDVVQFDSFDDMNTWILEQVELSR